MERYNEISQELRPMVYEICSKVDTDDKENTLNLLCKKSGSKKVLFSLLTLISDGKEPSLVRKYASSYFGNYMDHINPSLRSMMRIFLTNMKIPEKRESMKKGFFQFIDIISDSEDDINHDCCRFLVNLINKYLKAKRDQHLHELGAIMLQSLFKNMSNQIQAHEKEIGKSLKLALLRGKEALKEPSKSFMLIFRTLKCASISGRKMSKTSLILEPYRQSLEIILDLLKHVTFNGNINHLNDVTELLNVLLRDKNLSGNKWPLVVAVCHDMCRNEVYEDLVRIRALLLLGYIITIRSYYFQEEKVLSDVLKMLVEVLCQELAYDLNEPFEQQEKLLPTPMSVAADILEFVSKKFPEEKVTEVVVNFSVATIINRSFNNWEFRGVLISFGRITKNCSSTLTSKYKKELIKAFEGGFIWSSMHVRQAAVYALDKLFTHLPAEGNDWVTPFFTSLLQSFHLFVSDCKAGEIHQPLHVERLFGIMQKFLTIMGTDLIKYVVILTELCHDILEEKKQFRLIMLTVELLTKIVQYVRVAFLQHFRDLIVKLEPFLTNWDVCECDEIRVGVVVLLTNIMTHAAPDVLQSDSDTIIDLIFNMLKIQHARTQLEGADISFLLKYSPLRCSVFLFFEEVAKIIGDKMTPHMPKIVGTLLGTVYAIRQIPPRDLNRIGLRQRIPTCENSPTMAKIGKAKRFKVGYNNEIETVKVRMKNESYTLYDEVYLALIALQNIRISCATAMEPYEQAIFYKLGGSLSYSYGKLRKQILYMLNDMLVSFLHDFHFTDADFIKGCVIEMVNLLPVESDVVNIGESVIGFLHYVAIKEKYFEPEIDTHSHNCGMMVEVFKVVTALPNEGAQRRQKDSLLSRVIAFLSKLEGVSHPKHFSNYFNIYLSIFEAKITMPIVRSAISDENRCEAYNTLIEAFHLSEPDNDKSFNRILPLFVRGLNDPLSTARKDAASGLGMLVNYYDPQPVKVYKRILNILWKRSKREKDNGVIDCISYAMVLTISKNMWQLPIKNLLPKIIRLLPMRKVTEYNTAVIIFFETLWLERPDTVTHVTKDIFKYLTDLLQQEITSDNHPLFKRVLSLGASLSRRHFEVLNESILDPITKQAILAARRTMFFAPAQH